MFDIKSNPFCLKDKKILVTGASSGLGKAIAIACSKMGAQMIITSRNEERLIETYRSLEGEGHSYIIAELTNSEDINKLIEFLPFNLDGVVNNAGVNKTVVCQYINQEDISFIIKTNFEAPVLLTKCILKKKKILKGGSIVFISSRAVYKPTIGNALYSASKGALDAYLRVLALELAPKRIRVNSINPAMIRTELLEKISINSEQYDKDEKRYPLGRYGKPEDVAYLALYLLSDASVWMTGNSITLDGGVSLL